jgi:hypothetical protein
MLGGLGFGVFNDSPGPLPSLGLLGGLGKGNTRLPAESGLYNHFGSDTGPLLRVYNLTAERGLYATQGQVAILTPPNQPGVEYPGPLPHIGMLLRGGGEFHLPADTGIYTYSVSDSFSDFEADPASGVYGVQGFPVTFRAVRSLIAEAGAYFFNGKDAGSGITGTSRTMPADSGAYFISGMDLEIVHNYTLACEQGFYGLAGQAATFEFGLALRQLRLGPESGFYTHQGPDTILFYSGGHPVFPGGPPGQGGGGFRPRPTPHKKRVLFVVRTPDGKDHEFYTQKEADEFRRKYKEANKPAAKPVKAVPKVEEAKVVAKPEPVLEVEEPPVINDDEDVATILRLLSNSPG